VKQAAREEANEEAGRGAAVLLVQLRAGAERARADRQRLSHDLVLAIARAKVWMRDLRGGKYSNTEQIARQFKLNDAHVRRLLRFCYLAPDIVEAVIEGRQPRSLTVKRLLKGIPRAWNDQREAFGFTN
jgi:hypothetical protein